MGDQLRHADGNRVPVVVYGKDLVDEVDLVVKAGGAGEIRFDVDTTDGNGWTLSVDASAAAYLIHLLAGELFKTKPLSEFVYGT